jgi:Glycosyltransferase family 87
VPYLIFSSGGFHAARRTMSDTVATPGVATASYFRLPRTRAAFAYLGLVLVVLAGVGMATLVSEAHSPVVQGGRRGLPEWIAGPFADLGWGRLTHDQFYLLLGVMALGYGIAITLGAELRARWLVGAIVVLHAAFLLAAPLLSTDVFNYIDYARLGALHGVDPYIHGPIAAPSDPAFVHTAWRHMGSAYGPLFTIASYPLAHTSVVGALWWLKGVAALSSLCCVGLVWAIARRLGRSPVPAAAVFGLNPLLLAWTVGGAHNDLLMLALMLAAVWLALSERETFGGAVLVAAAAVKATAVPVLAFMAIGVRRHRGVLLGAAAAGLAVYALAALAFPGHPLGVVPVLEQQHELVGFSSVPKQLSLFFGLPVVTNAMRTGATVLLLGALLSLAVRVWRGADWVTASGWAMVALVATSTWFVGWYAVWSLPFAAVSRSKSLLAATLGLQAFFVASHIPHLMR